MKDWKPEREFGKADFKGRKKPAAPPLTGGSPPAEKPREEDQRTTDVSPDRVVKAWRPPDIADSARSSPQRPHPASADPPPGKAKPRPFERMQPGALTGGERLAAEDLGSAVLGDLVASRPREAADLLRRWYWEKAPASSGIPPHTRIHFVLHSIPEDVLVELYRYFTAMERRQLHEIYLSRRTAVKNEVLAARRQFMEGLSEP